eukprot:CAMPEP_0116121144 /NCGR_PEP_ID=MMETSP0329-20121206/3544_1 /TAXON_ID=697910 /ORGANISM="Pseudo-nitzschia arenysensis, Strain B593" /LENGTH=198 /DNA_ID=CAMNT_0003614945 /DNA_START=84 /DNA_END=677 /DNA_ORIENTATION=+
MSIVFPVRDYTLLVLRKEVNKPTKLRIDTHYRDLISRRSKSIWVRGGGSDGTVFGTIPSFFHDIVKPIARDARDRFHQRVDEHLEQKFRKREENLKRNKFWRERAESSKHSASPSSSYASSSQLESSSTLESSSYSENGTPQKSLSLPTRVLKLSLVATFVTEILDRIGILDGDTTAIIWARIVDFWENDVLQACANW